MMYMLDGMCTHITQAHLSLPHTYTFVPHSSHSSTIQPLCLSCEYALVTPKYATPSGSSNAHHLTHVQHISLFSTCTRTPTHPPHTCCPYMHHIYFFIVIKDIKTCRCTHIFCTPIKPFRVHGASGCIAGLV